MFAIGRNQGFSVAGLFAGIPAAELATMGEYGVQYLASERGLEAPGEDLQQLGHALNRSDLDGILVLDTRPILDYFTRSAMLAADLVLIPVKDRASLVNAASLHQVLAADGGDPGRLWLLPSLVDARLRLKEDLGVRDYLVFAARERGYQVLETFIPKSPKVEGLATNLTSRVYPVLTHARTTAAHPRFKELAGFVLNCFDERNSGGGETTFFSTVGCSEAVPRGRVRHLVDECPVCNRPASDEPGHHFQDLRSRRRGQLHGDCLQQLLEATDLKTLLPDEGTLAFVISQDDEESGVRIHLFEEGGEEAMSERLPAVAEGVVDLFLQAATGRYAEELFREMILITLEKDVVDGFLLDPGHARFAARRKAALKEVLEL